jgi:hypothetical protein
MPDHLTQPEDIDDSEFPDVEAEFGGTSATVEYHCTEEELAEAGYEGGFTVRTLDDMPEHESEFLAPAVVTDPLDYTEAPYGGPLRALLESVEQWDWTEIAALTRLVNALTADWMGPVRVVSRAAR